MIETLRHARAQLVAAQSRCQRPSVDAQFAVASAEALLSEAERSGKGYARALAECARALVELAECHRRADGHHA